MNKMVEMISAATTSSEEATRDILVLRFTIVTACMVGDPGSGPYDWVLVDTGPGNSGGYILETAERRFGKEARPKAIILTHGHFDHVGSVKELAERWDAPVFAHELELPYIRGRRIILNPTLP